MREVQAHYSASIKNAITNIGDACRNGYIFELGAISECERWNFCKVLWECDTCQIAAAFEHSLTNFSDVLWEGDALKGGATHERATYLIYTIALEDYLLEILALSKDISTDCFYRCRNHYLADGCPLECAARYLCQC